MGCLGVHFALPESEVLVLKNFADEEDRLNHVQGAIEEAYLTHHKKFTAQSDKAWDALHRALADGHLSWDGGSYPLNHAVLAGEILYSEDDYIMSLKSPTQVREIADAMAKLSKSEFRSRYLAIDAAEYGMPLDENDLEYTWEAFQDVLALYARAAEDGRYVLFTADQ